MEANETKASKKLKATIDATTKGLMYQTAELWLERHPDATAKELLQFLAERAEAARRVAVEAELLSGELTEEEAVQLVGKYMDYRAVLIDEMDGA